jgi:ribosomal protein S18 acetylase RimI-like enzyme
MIVRTAELEDCAAVARVQVNSYRSAYARLLPADYLASFSYEEQEQDWRDLLKVGLDTLLVAVEDGKVVGYALSRPMQTDDRPFDCELVALHVDRDHQRRGVGRALVAATARHMQQLGCRSLGLWVMEGNPAAGFYERLGGQPCGEHFFDLDDSTRQREIGFVWPQIEMLFAASEK